MFDITILGILVAKNTRLGSNFNGNRRIKAVLELGVRIPVVNPMKCVARVANRLSISEKTKHHALGMMEEVVNKKITAGKEPMGLAATVLYASSIKTDEKIPQKDIAAASGVTEVTIRNRFKDLKKILEN
jgi:transcription initiation factor TFIIB